MRDVLKIVFVIIGSFIGAGFASGQEVYLFFFSYGYIGLIGLIISSILFGIIIYKILTIIYEKDIKNYIDFLNIIFKFNRKIKNRLNICEILNIIINIFIVISFFIMIAGFGAFFEQKFNINKIIGSSILSIICFFSFLKNIKGLIKINEILVPILILVICIIGILNIFNIAKIDKFKDDLSENVNFINNNKILDCIYKSLLYTSYNIILMVPLLITLKEYIKTKNSIFFISIICTFIFCILILLMYFLLLRANINISKIEMPVVYIIERYYNKFGILYSFIILAAILTTALSEGISLLNNVCKNRKSYTQFAGILCITSIVISNFGFSNLVKLVYSSFGILGIIEMWYIIKNKNFI